METATWSRAGTLDWWVKERRPRLEWLGRVRGADGKQWSIKAVDLRPARNHGHDLPLEWLGRVRGPMASSSRSKLLIFVPRAITAMTFRRHSSRAGPVDLPQF